MTSRNDFAPRPELELGLLSELAGNPIAAAEHYRNVPAAGDLDDSVTAAARLAALEQIDAAIVTSQLTERAETKDVLNAWVGQVNSSIGQAQWSLADIGLRQVLALMPSNDGSRTQFLRSFGSAAARLGETERARATLREAAEAGDAEAMRLIAWTYHDDESDHFTEWIGRAAEHGDTLAMYSVGSEANRAGDFETATRWMRRASDAGYVVATRALACMYSDAGEKVESERYLAKSAWDGNPEAMRQLARLLSGRGEDGPAQLWTLRATRRHLMAGKEDDELAFPNADPRWSAPWEEAIGVWLSATTWDECESVLAAHPILADEASVLYCAERLATEPEDSEYMTLTILQGILMLGRGGDTEGGLRVARDSNHAVEALLSALAAGDINTVVGVCNAGVMTFESDELLGPLTSLIVLITYMPLDVDVRHRLEPALNTLRSAASAADPEWLRTLREAVDGCINQGDSWRAIYEVLEPPATKRRSLFRSWRRG